MVWFFSISSYRLCFSDRDGERILSVQINTALEAQTIHLSELMDVSRIVTLETNDNKLLPEHFEIALTEKFIVTLPHEVFNRDGSIYQFDAEGSFIRELPKGGRGQFGYIGINIYAVDTKNEILYFMHEGDQSITRIDLNTGEFLKRISLPANRITHSETVLLSDLHVLPDGTLACTPKMEPGNDKLNYQIFYLSPEGEFAGGLPAYLDHGFNNPYAHTTVVNDELHFFGNTPDTLFLVNDTIRNPLMIVNTPVPFDVPSEKGYVLYDLLETPSSLVSMMVHYPVENSNSGIWKEPLSGIFFIDKANGQSFKVSSLKIDPLNIEIEPKVFAMYRNGIPMLQEVWFRDIFTSGGLGVIKIDVQSLNKETESITTANVLSQFKQVNAQLKESSNPVLVIGKWK